MCYNIECSNTKYAVTCYEGLWDNIKCLQTFIVITDNLLFWTDSSSNLIGVMSANKSEEHIIASIHKPNGITRIQGHIFITQPHKSISILS